MFLRRKTIHTDDCKLVNETGKMSALIKNPIFILFIFDLNKNSITLDV